jgi:hypothetical protein
MATRECRLYARAAKCQLLPTAHHARMPALRLADAWRALEIDCASMPAPLPFRMRPAPYRRPAPLPLLQFLNASYLSTCRRRGRSGVAGAFRAAYAGLSMESSLIDFSLMERGTRRH